ncbi:MAG: oligopeptide/dipeptide ABC transporter ATP-binding protein [Panacagrimonas sp.]
MKPLLKVENLSRRFSLPAPMAPLARLRGQAPKASAVHAVDQVSFELAQGESLGLVGESGCGKSSLVRLLTRLVDPSEGTIIFRDKHIGAVPASAFARDPDRAQIQQVFQDPTDSLNPRFTAFDCIADPLKRLAGLHGDALRVRVETTADQVSLPRALLTRYPHQLSGGQKLRVGIARGIALKPALLILDEPTSALDVSVQAVILRELARLRAELGLSYLFVSHDLNVVRMLCDKVMVMYLGRIVEYGPAEEVFANPRHPYTQALAAAVSSFDPDRAGSRVRLTDEPQSPINPPPTVCRFYSRCTRRQDLCRQQMPELAPGAAHAAACHFAVGSS